MHDEVFIVCVLAAFSSWTSDFKHNAFGSWVTFFLTDYVLCSYFDFFAKHQVDCEPWENYSNIVLALYIYRVHAL